MAESSSTIKPGQQKDIRKRLFILGFSIFAIISLLFAKIAFIQIIQNPDFIVRSESYREKIIRIPPFRGKILSSDEKVLADNIISFNVYLNPSDFPKNAEIKTQELSFLTRVLKINDSDFEKILTKNPKSKEEILIAENITFDEMTKLKENSENLKGVIIKEDLIRNYPNKKMLSHVLGYIGPIDANEFSISIKDEYQFSDLIGKSGIEKSFEKELRGVQGKHVFEIDARMNVQKEILSKSKKPQPGNELILSIDFDLQKNIEDILADRTGAIVVLKPSNGEILGMASYPNFDPNVYILQNQANDETKKSIALDTKGTPLFNRTIQAVYPPGSVFKIVASTIILQENIISTEKSFFCGGVYHLNNQDFKCWVYPSGHGVQNLSGALINSCDIYYYNASLKIGPDKISQYAKLFGFGNVLNIDLPFEASGFIPSVKSKKENNEIWHGGDTLITVIGQGEVLVSPLQIANFMSVVCNKGYAYKPHIVKKIRNSTDEKNIKEIKSEKIINLNLNENAFEYEHMALKRVTTEGTAGRAFASNKFKFAGKTGTAEVGKGKKKSTHSWFAGFGPIDYPLDQQIVVVVLCEYENDSYNRFAAPIASMVFSSYFMKEDYITTANRLFYPIKDSYAD